MEPYMTNPRYEDLDLPRGKESSFWALKLPKKHRKDMGLASTYLSTAPNLKEIKFKTFSPPFYFFEFSGSTFPNKQWAVGGERKLELPVPTNIIFRSG